MASIKSITAKLLAIVPWTSKPVADLTVSQPVSVHAQEQKIDVAGTEPGWLRVLSAEQLLDAVRAAKALKEIWRQSRQSESVWKRDLLPAIHRYAEFVQLMPASEAHHHAHAGGLLSHTIEMLVAAMTWRNAHLLPANEQIEVIDNERDQWTYVVFFAALLHDIAKPMTDLRIQWRSDGMADSIRWAPTGGSLSQITQGRKLPEYLVDFTPKSQRDYTAHARMAQLLLPYIVPESALGFLACSPRAIDALGLYLTGQDKDSLVASIVKRADQVSTQRALLHGSKARFATSRAVPLIDLLMQAIGSMLRSGTALPLNRSGAAGWVFDGAIWFVAKRLADSTREWIRTHEPDEAVPGEAKNDRLFDTWQEYGVIDLNPVSGQAIWHVRILGNPAEEGANRGESRGAGDAAGESGQGAYMLELTVLKFPLSKLFESDAQYPEPMRGRIEVRSSRKDKAFADSDVSGDSDADAASGNSEADAGVGHLRTGASVKGVPENVPDLEAVSPGKSKTGTDRASEAAANVPAKQHEAAPISGGKKQGAKTDKQADKLAAVMKAPAFNRPKPAAKPPIKADAAQPQTPAKSNQAQAATAGKATPEIGAIVTAGATAKAAPRLEGGDKRNFAAADAAYLMDDSPFLDASESALAAKPKATRNAGKSGVVKSPGQLPETAAMVESKHLEEPVTVARTVPHNRVPEAEAMPKADAPSEKANLPKLPQLDPMNMLADLDALLGQAPQPTARSENDAPAPAQPEPVILKPDLPRLHKDGDGKPAPEPSALAIEFMRWVQQSLVSKDLTYNETGAAVHFVPEGMALISPLIFRKFAATQVGDDGAQDLGARVQREVIKAGWHMAGPNRKNILRYAVVGKGATVVSHLSCVVLVDPGRWVQPVPPSNPVLKLV